jgi:hypothetical protein
MPTDNNTETGLSTWRAVPAEYRKEPSLPSRGKYTGELRFTAQS